MQVTDKKQILIFSIVSTLTMSLSLAANSQSQPIVILEYPTFTNSTRIILITFLFKIMIIQQLTKSNQTRPLAIYWKIIILGVD